VPLNKYSVRIAGHPTSISLEPEFWAAFGRVAARRGKTVGALVTEIDARRDGGLSSAIRLFVLADLEGGGPTVSQ
jgi:predicted DNA-binding ribbon-helix-helix protein